MIEHRISGESMDAKHTPGPWWTKREGFSTVYVEARIEGGWIQEVAACGPTEAGQEQQEANARLIAAAPELLEALKEIADYWNRGRNDMAMHDACWHAIHTAEEAIAKATGEQA